MQLRRILPAKWEMTTAIALVMALTVLGTAVGVAGNGGFQSGGGSWSSPLTFFGVAVGLGNNVVLSVTATADGMAPAVCQNNGGNVAPGQVGFPATGSTQGFWTSNKNGKASGETGAILPGFVGETPSWEAAGCPNASWTVSLDASRVEWNTVHAVGELADGTTFDITLTCTTSFRGDGTTFGRCVES